MSHKLSKSLVVMLLTALSVGFVATSASATKYVSDYFGNPDAAGGTTGGLFAGVRGVAVNDDTGAIYVVDGGNNRIQQFDSSRDFVRTWGRDVIVDGAANANGTGFEVCDTTAGNTAADCKEGTTSESTGGAMSSPRGVAVNQTTGHVYVTDGGFRRVQEFTATGEFVRAWGGDVVVPGGTGETFLPGGIDERQTVALFDIIFGVPSGGTFTLTFDGQTTDAIAYNASADAVDSALEALSNIGAGDVAVTGPNGGTWTVDFTGALAGTDVPALVGDGSALLSDFGPGFGGVSVATTVPGGPSGAHEICEIQSECQAGVANASFGGAFGPPFIGYPTVAPADAPNAGNVLVADPANSRVQEFTSTGGFVRTYGFDVDGEVAGTGFEICTNLAVCKAGASGDAVGQFGANEPRRIAVASSGDVYALEMVATPRVQRFTGPGLSASLFADAELAGESSPSAVRSPTDIVVNPVTGRVFVAKSGSTGTSFSACRFESPGERRILEFSPSGVLRDTHMTCAGISYAPAENGLAVRSSNGEIYTSADQYTDPDTGPATANRIWVLDDGGITPAVATLDPATDVTATSAALSGTVNSNSIDNSFEPTRWRLEISRNGTDWSTASSGAFPAGTSPQVVTGSADGLRPNTLYRTRIITSKPFGNPEISSPELTLLTDAVRPEIRTTNSQVTSGTSAVLTARINPHGTPTSYRFEWGQGEFDRAVPVPNASIGSGPDFLTVSQQLSGLTPNTTYQYRAVAVSSTEGVTVGPTRSFTTAGLATVPTSTRRGYELVSPADKVGGQGVGSWYQGYGNHSPAGVPAISGDRFASATYYGGVLVDGAVSLGGDWALGERTPSGWANKPAFNRAASLAAYRIPLLFGAYTDDLQVTSWTSQSTHALTLFPEQETVYNGKFFWGGTLRDWTTGKWEFFGPTAAEQNASSDSSWRGTVFAANGDYAVMAGMSRGLAGAGDPTRAQDSELVCDTGPNDDPQNTCNGSVYIDDISGGLSDTFPGAGVVSLVNVCTGAGPQRTTIPSVDGAGAMEAGQCPAPLAGHDARLISPLGATLPRGKDNVVSADGSRVFFLSPDPVPTAVSGATPESCSGSGGTTRCPPQLYVRQRGADGSVTTRWISRSTVAGQDASLTDDVSFEGATPDGDKVFFTTASPLTADDPNGGMDTVPSPNSVDLYMYDMPDSLAADPGTGTLTRISAGPTGDADANASALRLVAGDRVYFVTSSPLPDVPAPGDGTSTSPGGSVTQTATKNLYLYDAKAPIATRWRFVAQLPATTALGSCATVGQDRRGEALWNETGLLGGSSARSNANCFDGTPDGSFVTMLTDGRLTADDPDSTSGDLYGYDAEADELIRLTAAQNGGDARAYRCITNSGAGLGTECNGDGGISSEPLLGLVMEPPVAGDRIAFFESRSRLLPDDHNDVYDVYQWRNGELSLISTGAADADDTLYRGNDRTGRNVYLSTRDRLTWQDHDAVLDVYVARIGGGFAEPTPPTVCGALAGQCQGGGPAPVAVDVPTSNDAGDGNVPPQRRGRLSVGKVSKAQRKQAARTGVLAIKVTTSKAGLISATARARIGRKTITVGRGKNKLASAGTATITVRLSKSARQALRQGKPLKLALRVTQTGLPGRTATVLLKRGERS